MSNSTASETLQFWVGRKLSHITETGGIVAFKLWHSSMEGGGDLLDTFAVTPDTDPQDMAQELWDTACQDEETRYSGTVQRYVVHAYSRDSEEPVGQTSFVLNTKASRAAHGMLSGDTEIPSEKGLLAQLMRHNERNQLMLANLSDSTSARLAQENRELANRVRVAEARVSEITVREQELADRTLERRLIEAESVQNAKRLDELFGFVTSMVPLLAAKLLGTKAAIPGTTPLGAAPRDRAVSRFFASISEAELMGVIDALSPEHKIAAIELYKSFAEDHAAEQADKPGILRDSPPEEEHSPAPTPAATSIDASAIDASSIDTTAEEDDPDEAEELPVATPKRASRGRTTKASATVETLPRSRTTKKKTPTKKRSAR